MIVNMCVCVWGGGGGGGVQFSIHFNTALTGPSLPFWVVKFIANLSNVN